LLAASHLTAFLSFSAFGAAFIVGVRAMVQAILLAWFGLIEGMITGIWFSPSSRASRHCDPRICRKSISLGSSLLVGPEVTYQRCTLETLLGLASPWTSDEDHEPERAWETNLLSPRNCDRDGLHLFLRSWMDRSKSVASAMGE